MNKSVASQSKENEKRTYLAMKLNDDEYFTLIARCAIRDESALEQLYQAAGPYLNKVAYNILKSEDYSNDVLQEGFIQIWNHAGEYRSDKAKPLTWMTSIVRYRALDRLAREKKHSHKVERWVDEDDATDPVDQVMSPNRPDKSIIAEQDSQLLLECIETLNERTKVSIRMAYLKGLTRDDIAAQLNTSANTVKSWLRRGAERLRLCIENKTELNVGRN